MKWLELIIKHFKDIVIGIMLISIAALAFQWWQDRGERRQFTDLIGKAEKYDQISGELAKLRIEYKAQKDLLAITKTKFKEVAIEKDRRIASLTESVFTLKRQNRKRMGHDLVYKGKRAYEYDEVRIAGDDSPPIGWVMVSKSGKVRSGTYKFDIEVDNAQVIDEKTGKIKVYAKAYYVAKQDGLANRKDNKLKKWKGVKYPMKIKGGTAFVDPTKPPGQKSKFRVAVRAGMGVDASLYQKDGLHLRPNINMSVIGYGKSKRDLKFKFAQVGVSTTAKGDDVGVDIKPVVWRPVNALPNTYIGAGISYSAKKGKGFTAGLSFNF